MNYYINYNALDERNFDFSDIINDLGDYKSLNELLKDLKEIIKYHLEDNLDAYRKMYEDYYNSCYSKSEIKKFIFEDLKNAIIWNEKLTSE